MPTVIVALLFALVIPYVLVAAGAALGFYALRRRSAPPPPDEWPSVTVVPTRAADAEAVRQALPPGNYPGRVEVAPPDDAEQKATPDGTPPTQGEMVLTLPPEASVREGWIRSMVRHWRSVPSAAVGPTLIRHDDLFLPRLHALQHFGRLTVLGAASYAGLPLSPRTANRARSPDAPPTGTDEPQASEHSPALSFTLEPDATVTRPPVDSVPDLLREQAGWFRRALRAPSRLVQGQAVGLWLVHAVLLACCVGAIAVPAWRQPTLTALLGKMGGDVLFLLPAASHFGQRRLLRSIVPTALMLVLSLPIAGGWALVKAIQEDDPAGPIGAE